MSGLVYLDASFALDVLDPGAARHSRAILAVSALPRYAVSELVRHELLIRPFRHRDRTAVANVTGFMDRGETLTIPDVLWTSAARLRADHGLKTPDALHLAIALHHGCTAFWTYDARLARLSVGIPILSP